MLLDFLQTLPLTEPIPIFLLVLLIILCAPLLNKLHIPHLVGLMLAGMLLGQYGLNVLANDQIFELFGRVGILYIMFLAGLEIDFQLFRRNARKGALFGVLSFGVPFAIGIVTSLTLLHFDWLSALLLSTVYASHTLIAYPAVGKMGVAKSRAASVAVAGTIVAVTLALFVLAGVLAVQGGRSDVWHWVRFAGGTVLFALIMFGLLPYMARWFLSHVSDGAAQFIFVLAVMFTSSLLAESVGLEGILGAFFAGLVLNRLVPGVSSLMNRIKFVGNAIFIPFFLISIGMMIDLSVFVHGWAGVYVATIMTVVVLGSKWLAAWLTQLLCGMRSSERALLFGLSVGHAAVTLAVVTIGYRTGLLDVNVLNGSVLMIFLTCTASTISTERAARNIASEELRAQTTHLKLGVERILVALRPDGAVQRLVDLANLLKPTANKNALFAICVNAGDSTTTPQQLLDDAVACAATTDNHLTPIIKHSVNVTNAIVESVAEYGISDVLLNVHRRNNFADTFYGNVISGVLRESTQNVFVCSWTQPVNAVKRLVVVVPEKAELEQGFELWFDRVRNMAVNLGTRLLFYANTDTIAALKQLCNKSDNMRAEFDDLASWEDFLYVTKAVRPSDAIVIISARKGALSYNPLFEKLPYYLTKYFANNNFALLFPRQVSPAGNTSELYNPLHAEF